MSTDYTRDRLHKNQIIMPWGKPETISTVDAAAMLQCDKSTVIEMIKDHRLKAYQLRPDRKGSPYRVQLISVERYIARLRENAGV